MWCTDIVWQELHAVVPFQVEPFVHLSERKWESESRRLWRPHNCSSICLQRWIPRASPKSDRIECSLWNLNYLLFLDITVILDLHTMMHQYGWGQQVLPWSNATSPTMQKSESDQKLASEPWPYLTGTIKASQEQSLLGVYALCALLKSKCIFPAVLIIRCRAPKPRLD